MSSPIPLVSIIIPTFNRARLLPETLDSVLAQTYQNWECIVVDDGSTDHTPMVMNDYCARDKRIQYHKRPNRRMAGGNGARNYGFEISKGEYIQWLDSDDLISDTKIEFQVISMLKNNADIATCAWERFIDISNIKEKIDKKIIYKDYDTAIKLFDDLGNISTIFPPMVYLTRRRVILNTGGWQESIRVNQDGVFFCKVLINCNRIAFVNNCVAYYRALSHAHNNKSYNNTKAKITERIKSWKLIDEYIYNEYGIKNSIYVDNAKTLIYNRILKWFPSLLFSNILFFKNQIKSKMTIKIFIKKIILPFFKVR